MLDTLFKYKQDINSAASRCENLSSPEDVTPEERSSTPLFEKASKVNGNLEQAIKQLEDTLARMRESTVQWESVDKMKLDLANWLMNKTREVTQAEEKPAKLHIEAAELDIAHLKVLDKIRFNSSSNIFYLLSISEF